MSVVVERGGDEAADLCGAVGERDVLESALDLRPFAPVCDRCALGVLTEGHVLQGHHHDRDAGIAAAPLGQLLEEVEVGVAACVGEGLEVLPELVYHQQDGGKLGCPGQGMAHRDVIDGAGLLLTRIAGL